jgi:hypothetical protein
LKPCNFTDLRFTAILLIFLATDNTEWADFN